ncbi:hypothetical protein [Salipiger sp.]|uniref:hypothetical protein n=1 Tax=Salipiger sp. TaxID=2078585 RepID=UPI003A97A7AC
MKILSLTLAALAATPALAHSGAHLHPHDGASWLVIAAALGVVALAARMALVRARAGAGK